MPDSQKQKRFRCVVCDLGGEKSCVRAALRRHLRKRRTAALLTSTIGPQGAGDVSADRSLLPREIA